MVLVKKWKIFHLFLFTKIGQENVFDYTQERKKVFLSYKNKELNKSKNIFSKGLVHGFGQKVENFLSISCWQNRPGKCD